MTVQFRRMSEAWFLNFPVVEDFVGARRFNHDFFASKNSAEPIVFAELADVGFRHSISS